MDSGRGDDGESVTAMAFATTNTGWFVTSEGRLFKTTDRGRRWKPRYVSIGRPTDVDFASAKTGWIARQGGVYRTTNGGKTWKG